VIGALPGFHRSNAMDRRAPQLSLAHPPVRKVKQRMVLRPLFAGSGYSSERTILFPEFRDGFISL
jgi:hypothetical protein